MTPEKKYLLDYDTDFEEMLKKLKNAKFHSSLIESEQDDTGFASTPGSLVWSPSLSPIVVDDSPEQVPSPKQISEKLTTSRRRNLAKHHQGIQIENIIIELGSDCEDSSDESEVENCIDLNATYTAKTMKAQRLSLMLDVLQEIETADEQQSKSNSRHENNLEQSKISKLPMPELATPSPCTPNNKFRPLPDRSFRLMHVGSNHLDTPCSIPNTNFKSIKRSHESNTSHLGHVIYKVEKPKRN